MTPYIRFLSWLLVSLAMIGNASAAPPRPVLLTGEVIAIDSQTLFVPPSNSAPVLLRNFVAEGTAVKKGDLVLRIEAKESNNLSQQEIELEQAKARAKREVADLAVKAIEAEKALLMAESALQKARVDAAVPREHLSALDYDRYQGERERTQHDLELKTKAAANANESVARRRADGELEAKKLLFNLLYLKSQLAEAEVRATRDGIVVHAYSEWRGERSDEGSSAFPGNTAGHILGSGQMQVRAWALEADRPFLAEGQAVRLGFDALPDVSLIAKIERIAGAPQSRTTWGSGRYFQVDIQLPAKHSAPLVPGMSVIIEPEHENRQPASRTAAAPTELTLEGEIASLRSIAIGPPEIAEVWQFQLAQLAPEGAIVQPGEPIAVFGAQDLGTKLDNKQSALKEKQRALEKLKLDHAEAAKAADIAVSQAQSDAEKAARKAEQPRDQIRRIDYDKLLIDRDLTAQSAELAARQRDAQSTARAAERVALDLEIEQLETAIAQLTQGLASLTVTAKQSGLVLYRPQFNGEKFAIGSQVWMGLSVATLADPEQLIVNATVPESQAVAVRVGQRARINVPGANVALNARVKTLGRIYHIKSRTQPVIVRDVQLEFDTPPKGVKPGAAVQVALLAAEQAQVASSNQSSGAK
jgi:multidrug resistance efflux pump